MKIRHGLLYNIILPILLFTAPGNTFAQKAGTVLINEYLTWTGNACPTETEFVEIMNFGPGPMDIGCYILTNGTVAIRIPPNTIIQPGDYYVLGGQDILPQPCANIDSSIKADLNWNTCNCTNIPITSPEGFLSDGTTANEKLVLLDANLNVVDAVARDLPVLPSQPITLPGTAGGCGTTTFDLTTMDIKYEVLGMSAGRGNSFARTIDGDCIWVKDPQQSANATNNKSGTTDITYAFTVENPLDCDSTHGKVSVFVKHSDYSLVFPMNYTLAIDSNNNGVFDLQDSYNTYIDSTPPIIEIYGLPVGHFRVTVSSINGCYLKTFEFTILPCYPTLPVKLLNFRYAAESTTNHKLEWALTDVEYLQSISVEKASIFGQFKLDKTIAVSPDISGTIGYTTIVDPNSPYKYYRLKITNRSGSFFYSPVLSRELSARPVLNKYWPNPVREVLHMELSSSETKTARYAVFNVTGIKATEGILNLKPGINNPSIPVAGLIPGIYQLQVSDANPASDPISFRFVKH